VKVRAGAASAILFPSQGESRGSQRRSEQA
jgi:hypothetical protein